MGYSTKRAYKITEELRERILEAYSHGTHFKLTHDAIVVRLNERVWNDPRYAKLPQWAKSILYTTTRCKLDEIHRRDLVWTHEVDGVRFISGQLPEGVTYAQISEQSDKSAHCWKGEGWRKF